MQYFCNIILLLHFYCFYACYLKNLYYICTEQKQTIMKLQDEINYLKSQLVYNRKRVLKRAWYLFKNNDFDTLGEAITYVCAEVRVYRAEKRERLIQLEYALLCQEKEKWNVPVPVEFYMRKDWMSNDGRMNL